MTAIRNDSDAKRGGLRNKNDEDCKRGILHKVRIIKEHIKKDSSADAEPKMNIK